MNTNDFMILLLIGVGWIWGIYGLTAPGMLLEKPSIYLWERYPTWITKPTFGCPPCMSSIHGTLIFLIFLPNENFICLLVHWVFYMVSLSGINFVIKEHLYD